MLAKELVSILEETNPDYSRQSLLQEINFIQRLILGTANSLNKAIDPTTGKDLQITPATAEHVVTDALRIDRVYSSDYNIPLKVNIQGNTIYFSENNVGQSYYIRYYKKTAELTSEMIELTIPDEHIDDLEEGVLERLASQEHGSREGFRYWKKMIMPRVQRRLNSGYKWGSNES